MLVLRLSVRSSASFSMYLSICLIVILFVYRFACLFLRGSHMLFCFSLLRLFWEIVSTHPSVECLSESLSRLFFSLFSVPYVSFVFIFLSFFSPEVFFWELTQSQKPEVEIDLISQREPVLAISPILLLKSLLFSLRSE